MKIHQCFVKKPRRIQSKSNPQRRQFGSPKLKPHKSSISGVYLIPNFVEQTLLNSVLFSCTHLRTKLTESLKAQSSPGAKVSLSHNLPSREVFNGVLFDDGNGPPKKAQVFPEYGSKGHMLAYFIGINNIPTAFQQLIKKILKIEEIGSMGTYEELNHRMTLNVYQPDPETNRLAGFPFHRDIASNGEITIILTLKQSATLQMVKPIFDLTDGIQTEEQLKQLTAQVDNHELRCESVQLDPGSLFILSKEGRWDWVHRVLPQPATPEMERISVVFGMTKIRKG